VAGEAHIVMLHQVQGKSGAVRKCGTVRGM